MLKVFSYALRRLSLPFAFLVSLTFFHSAAPQALAQDREWQPQRTWVFVVGTLEWEHSDVFDSFPKENRRDARLADFFRRQGVPAGQLVYLKDAEATTRRVRDSLAAFLSRAREGDLLFLYYCGHGYKSDDARTTFFATYDASDDVEGWSTDSIVREVERHFKGSRAILAADCCYSGSLAEQARKLGRRVSFACLTSSSASQVSTGNWTFTEMLLDGLEGRAYADLNGDGRITLGEIAEDVEEDMAFAEEQLSTFVTTGAFAPGTVVAKAGRKAGAEVGRRVEVRSEGDWYKARVIDAGAGRLRVHYYGWEDSDDEWVRADQLRDRKVVQYDAGASVEVRWKKEWYPAKVLQAANGLHLIHYVGYDDGWDEWVGANRIRQP
jgi:hypothetical protein